jgi:hypothetical protein|tara:strand:- start:284 stop:508 length:225 start_codon:yes stop_codon:yes gene_type:complete
MMLNRIESKAPKYARNKYIVAMTVEFYKEMVVKAGSPEEAQQMAEMRVRARQKNLLAGGYSIGDVDMIEVKEEK